MTKLLIDECLSSELALMARQRGHHEASHVVWIGKSGWKDWELKGVLLDEDWVLVVTAELPLFHTHGVGIQEGPGLSAKKLVADLERDFSGASRRRSKRRLR